MTALAIFPNIEIEPGIYFASEPVEIGDKEWRVIVRDSLVEPRRVHAYQWRVAGDLPLWQEHTRWPGFDFSSANMGLPLSLAKLYEANLSAIEAAKDWWSRL